MTVAKTIAAIAVLSAMCAFPAHAEEQEDNPSLAARLEAARLEAYRTAQLPLEAVKPEVEWVDCFYAENAGHPACAR